MTGTADSSFLVFWRRELRLAWAVRHRVPPAERAEFRERVRLAARQLRTISKK